MQKYIEVLEDNYVNTYEIVFKEDNKLNYYEEELKKKKTYHVHSGETKAANYDELKRILLSYSVVDEVCDMQLGNKHVLEYGFIKTTFGYYYKALYAKYPMLYHVLFNDNDMLHDLYYYLTNNNALGPKYDEKYELLQFMDCNYVSFYDQHIPDEEKIVIIKDFLDSILFKKVSSRFVSNIDEYKNLKKRTNDIKELTNFVYKQDKDKKKVLGEKHE